MLLKKGANTRHNCNKISISPRLNGRIITTFISLPIFLNIKPLQSTVLPILHHNFKQNESKTNKLMEQKHQTPGQYN